MDNNTELLFEEVLIARKVNAFMGNLFDQTTNKVELKLEDIPALIGKTPIQLEREFDTPDLWERWLPEQKRREEDIKLIYKRL